MSIWPLVTRIAGHAHGINRILFPALDPLVGHRSYYNIGNDLLALSVIPLGLVALFRKNRLEKPGQLPLLLATSSGFLLMLVTGTPGYYFLLVIFLLAISRPALNARTYWSCMATLSATTFFSEYGMGAYWLTHSSVWSVGVYDPNIPLTRYIGQLPTNDWFITTCCVANCLVLVLMMINLFRRETKVGEPMQMIAREGADLQRPERASVGMPRRTVEASA